jgi:tetratricopeptide (TPR) repeat protein
LIVAQALEPQESQEISEPVALLGTRARNLQARSWAQLANALRIQGDLVEAEKAFSQAELVLDDSGRSGQLDRARICDLLASLRRDQRRYADAFQLYELAIAIYQRLGRWHLLGRTLAQKSMVCGEIGESAMEMKLLRRALDLLDPQEEPRMFLAARHNLILALNESSRHREAFALLFHTRPLYLQNGDRMNLLRLRWLEGQVSLGLGRIEQAETAFREVRQSFLNLDLAYEAALASLDLAAVYATQQRNAEMRELAEEMFAIFQSCHIHREAMAAILVFHSAAAAEQVGLDLVREVAAFLRRSRTDPELQFSRSS